MEVDCASLLILAFLNVGDGILPLVSFKGSLVVVGLDSSNGLFLLITESIIHTNPYQINRRKE